MALLTFSTGVVATISFHRTIGRRAKNRAAALGLSAAVAAVPITAEVWFISNLFDDGPLLDTSGVAPLFGMCLVIALAITVIYDRAPVDRPSAQTETGPAPSSPPFFRRLPARLGKDLISLQAQDHYVEVTTRLGRELVLIRLSDAESELDGYPGMRVHRSWWVAADAVEGMRNENGKPVLVLANGAAAPVSREKRAEVRRMVERAAALSD